ncbi:MAG: hypothetical protein IKC69_03465 [Clostridia bacterium]|nr:hypothetical protein [Clostridia bacterium]
MRGEGITLTCGACGASYEMKEDGTLAATEGETEFSHIPDWYAWERQTVRRELEEGTYRLDVPVSVGVICDHKAMYLVGEGRLVHTREGMTLYDDKGRAVFTQDPWGSHSLNVDFFFYEMGDMIGIGSKDRLYYCFVQKGVPVTKARLAAEEMYEMPKPAKRAAEKAGE